MQKNQIIAMLLCFASLLMFIIIFVTMRLVNIFLLFLHTPAQADSHNFRSDAKCSIGEDRAVDGDDGVTVVTEPAPATV
ncbi:predicted protein [Sclerotinia sclerotiorum 1980 UF-70]|uniref:Uncharacterized protein n=1 Tax=Sclerotinia sclerotiorum (strain ATCC 18683 / 1980 / Ss-1) TaxID=665079 RepID=A7F7X4_SCLS1|nr:predicted protein [Sclerotinia sclerotiorum 1980 UF-70]EDN98845.1 predicted protein [Sclerotinia sclerotiorum 1980 UF-70]